MDREGIILPTLRDDLIDHICCAVEQHMLEGVGYKEALKKALVELAPSGLAEIQKETFKVLNSKDRRMKKLSFGIGMCCSIAMGIGCLLSVFKLPMGHMIFGLAAFCFVGFFVPLDAFRQIKYGKKPLSEKLSAVFSSASTIVLATGVLARLLFLPGANEMIAVGLVIFVAGFLPVQFFRMYREAFAS